MTVVAWIICIAIMVALLAISISLSKLVHILKVMLNDERRRRARYEEELRELRMTQEELARRRSGSR